MSVSGKFLTCKLGSTVIAGNYSWSVEESGEKLDKTTGADSGRGNQDIGVIDTTVQIKGYHDNATGVYTPIRSGTTLTDLKLFVLSTDTDPAFAFSSATVGRSRIGAEVRGKFEWDCECYPSGNVVAYTEAGARTS